MPSEEISQRPGKRNEPGQRSGDRGRQRRKVSPAQILPPEEDDGPQVAISGRAADRLRAGHLWVYRSDLKEAASPLNESRLVAVTDPRGALLGTALYSGSSQIALRMVSRGRIDLQGWMALLRERLESAIRFRKNLLDAETDSCRLVYSEADLLPGLIADKYGDLVVMQTLTQGMASTAVAKVFLDVITAEIDPSAIFTRSDPKIRMLEELPPPPAGPSYLRPGSEASASAVFRLNGLSFHFEANSGQKTGAFLDQRENYVAAARYCRGQALDVCTYQGGFAIHLGRSCSRVTGVDASRAALEVAERNLELNRDRIGGSEIDWIEANAFDLLRDWSDTGVSFDSIVLDPPAFAKSKRAVEGALRGYKELTLRALKMLRPGGTLVTCSCSHHIPAEDFTAVVAAAATDARRAVRLLERRGAAPDHPVLMSVPETEYLKCLICRAD